MINDKKRIKKKKYPLTYVGHCDMDYHTINYPCPTTYNQYGLCPPVNPGTFCQCPEPLQNAFSGWWSALVLALGGLGTTAFYLYTELKKANTLEEKQAIYSDAYNRFVNGEITEDEYRLILGAGTSQKAEDEEFFNIWWKKYKNFVYLGSGAVIVYLLLSRRR